MTTQDYYEILCVDQNASQNQIRNAYRKLAFQYHPDRHKDDPGVAERMKEINESYAVLSNPLKKREYDALRQAYGSSAHGQFRQSYTEEDIFRGSDINQILEEMARAFGFRGFNDIFREFYGPGYRTFHFQRPGTGASHRAFVFSHLGKRDSQSSLPGMQGGLGRALRWGLKRMWGIEWPEAGKDQQETIILSPERAGAGGKVLYEHRKRSTELVVQIPPGIKEGQSIRLKGMGEEGKGGARAGDLYLKVKIRHSFLQRLRGWVQKLLSKLAPTDRSRE
jgi:curved DNA-binding protein